MWCTYRVVLVSNLHFLCTVGISQFMLGERPFLLREKFQSDHMQVVDSIQDFLKLAGELLFELPLYLFVSTKKWRQAVDAQNLAIEEITKVGKLYNL